MRWLVLARLVLAIALPVTALGQAAVRVDNVTKALVSPTVAQFHAANTPTVTARGKGQEIYIAWGADVSSEDGTAEYPFLVDTAVEFDALLDGYSLARTENVVNPLTIHLVGPGKTFLTKGFAISDGDWPSWAAAGSVAPYIVTRSGWAMYSGWELDLGRNTLKLDSWPLWNGPVHTTPNVPWPYGHTVVGSFSGQTGYQGNDCKVRNGKIDCNWPGVSAVAGASTSVSAIILYGSDIEVDHVEYWNHYGDFASGKEGFGLKIEGSPTSAYFVDTLGYPDFSEAGQHLAIKNCKAHTPNGNYYAAFVAATDALAYGGLTRHIGRDTLLENCIVLDHTATNGVAFQFNGQGAKVHGNYSDNCFKAIYVDTGQIYDLVATNNHFLRTISNCVLLSTGSGSEYRRWRVENNTFEVQASATQASVCVGTGFGGGDLIDLKFVGNTLRTSGTGAAARYSFNVSNINGLHILDNFVESTLSSVTIAASVTPKVIRGNYTETFAAPTGLADTDMFSGTASVNFASMVAGTENTQTVTVAGAATTNTPSVSLGWSAALEDGIVFKEAWVSGIGTVSIRVRNTTAGTIDPVAVTIRATVRPF